MGVKTGHALFGISQLRVAQLTTRLRDKRVAFEVYGLLHHIIVHDCSKYPRSRFLAEHLWTPGMDLDTGLIWRLATTFAENMAMLRSAGAALVFCVFEGRFPFKSKEAEKRRAAKLALFGKKAFCKCLTVPDCLARAVAMLLQTMDGVQTVFPPGDADAQLCYLRVRACVQLLPCRGVLCERCYASHVSFSAVCR